MDNLLYVVDGNAGKKLMVYEDRCVISAGKGFKSVMLGFSLNGDKEFYYSDITSVQFKNLSMTSGYLEFEFPGSHSVNSYASENSFVFAASIGTPRYYKLKEEMPKVYADIQKRVKEAKRNRGATVQALSPADELMKFKGLLDAGVITQEEFDRKKNQLLGL